MSDMPRPRPPHLHRQVARSGEVIWYVRIGKGKRTRIRGEYGSPEFMRAYRAALAGESLDPRKPAPQTVGWLIARYRESGEYSSLAQSTRRQRDNILRQIAERAGSDPIGAMTRRAIIAAMDRRKDTPDMANGLLKALRAMFGWALRADLVEEDPTIGVKKLRGEGKGFAAWTADDIAKFEERWPVGTRERLAFDLLLHTGLRRGDVVRLGRQHIRDGVIELPMEKAQERRSAYVLIGSALAEVIDRIPRDRLTFLVTQSGKPWVKEAFGNWFREACNAAGVDKSAHGLRKAGAAQLAERGATVAELMARFGWASAGMATHYTKTANRRSLAIEAGLKLEQSIPSQLSREGIDGKKR